MENNPNEAQKLYEGYRGSVTRQPSEASNEGQESLVENYQPPDDSGYQPPPEYGYQQQPLQPGRYEAPFDMSNMGDVSATERTSMGIRACTAGWLCYLGGWITGLIFFLLEKENRFVRFHAMQSIIFFGAISVLTAMFSSISSLSFIGSGLGVVAFVCWIILMVSAARGKYYKLPIIGEYAQRWANAYRG